MDPSAGYREAPADGRKPIGIGPLGYGFMGRAHSNTWRTIPYVFWPSGYRPELVAISGRTEEAVREASVRYGYRHYATDWRPLLQDENVRVFPSNSIPANNVRRGIRKSPGIQSNAFDNI